MSITSKLPAQAFDANGAIAELRRVGEYLCTPQAVANWTAHQHAAHRAELEEAMTASKPGDSNVSHRWSK